MPASKPAAKATFSPAGKMTAAEKQTIVIDMKNEEEAACDACALM